MAPPSDALFISGIRTVQGTFDFAGVAGQLDFGSGWRWYPAGAIGVPAGTMLAGEAGEAYRVYDSPFASRRVLVNGLMPQQNAAEWPRIVTATLSDRVYHAVRKRIINGELAPGVFIRELRLTAAMGVSRSPVREALGRLASEGFLERIPRHGFRVPEEPVGNLLCLYPIVSALDLLAGRLALPRLTEVDVDRLRTINARLRAARDRGDLRLLIELNNEFHYVFGERSGNQRLSDLLEDLRSQLTRLEIWYYSDSEQSQRSIEEHDDIIRAIEQGGHERALTLLERNMSLTYTSLVDGEAEGKEASGADGRERERTSTAASGPGSPE